MNYPAWQLQGFRMKQNRAKTQSISGFKIEEVKPVKHFILLNVLQAGKKNVTKVL